MKKYQVIIAGAGPAGSACAKALKEEGIHPLIIEKYKLPRHKTCSGVLFGQTQVLLKKYFGQLPPKSVYCRPEIIKASDIQEWNRQKGFFNYTWELPKATQSFPTDYQNIWRDKFDYWLLKQSGAEYIESCSLRSFSADSDKVKVEVLHKNKTCQELNCSYLIGADGGNSQVRRLLDPSWSKNNPEVMVFQAYCRFSDRGSLKAGSWNLFFEPDICDTLCSIHSKDDFLTVCVGGFKGQNLKDSMETFKKFLSDNFNVAFEKEERVEGCTLRPSLPDLGSERVILTGEAAGFMYLNGEGISAAIDSGYRAGKAVSKAIKEDGSAAAIYREETNDILDHINVCLEKMHFFTNAP